MTQVFILACYILWKVFNFMEQMDYGNHAGRNPSKQQPNTILKKKKKNTTPVTEITKSSD